MTTKAAATLRGVRRGDEPNELQLLTTDGKVIILLGYGLTVDEGIRTRELAIGILTEVLTR